MRYHLQHLSQIEVFVVGLLGLLISPFLICEMLTYFHVRYGCKCCIRLLILLVRLIILQSNGLPLVQLIVLESVAGIYRVPLCMFYFFAFIPLARSINRSVVLSIIHVNSMKHKLAIKYLDTEDNPWNYFLSAILIF